MEITEKNIKRCYLRVYPTAKVALSLPIGYGPCRAKKFIISHLEWIEKRITKLKEKGDSTIYYLGNKVEFNNYSAKTINAFFANKKKEAYNLFSDILNNYVARYRDFFRLLALR